ncbi:MAG TPA: adenosylmethionine--8-amino-7-oxononanoate transaminase [Flavobacteriales bacterium]|nr:adenosylmethionine--8-amino-7-oxononanoate transaminase [Flavobacteriales bacterium]HIO46493.1 adenosylmethionine--8-amino-7-oxononanoate transaminase [Candidatus Poribacteria bacterium]
MSLSERDLKVLWHPYTQMKTARSPIGIVRGEGAWLYDEDGNGYLDAISSWWVNTMGHSNPHIAKEVAEQLNTLEHVLFAGFTHPKAVELAERLLKVLPKNQSRIFLSDNGSTAVEVAIKMALQFWNNKGQQKNKIIAFHGAYHGDTFGAMSVSGRGAFVAPFESLLFEVEFIEVPTPGSENASSRQLNELIEREKDNLAAFIYEPLIQGASGMIMYEPEALDALLTICRSNNILTIADEVMTGFGRTGKYFASEYMTVDPDIICMSKGITGGTMALGATSSSAEMYDAFYSDDKLKTFFHGHSYTANPVACSAACASLDLYDEEETWVAVDRIGKQHQKFAERLTGLANIKDVRQRGTIIAIELNTDGGTSYFSNIRDSIYDHFIGKGIILRPLGNIIYILPPYIISEEDLQSIYDAIIEFLDNKA